MRAYLGPMQWRTDGGVPQPFFGEGSWNPPPGTRKMIDLRSNDYSKTRNVAAFLVDGGVRLGRDYEEFPLYGSLDPDHRRRLFDMVGVSRRSLRSASLSESIMEIISEHSDHTGAELVKTHSPKRTGRVSANILGFREVARVDVRRDSPVRRLLQANYARIRADWIERGRPVIRGKAIHQKFLGDLVRKLRLSSNEYRFIQGGLPDEPPIEPETTYTDNFDGATANLNTLGWTYESGQDYERDSGSARRASGLGVYQCEYASDLSTDDHYAQVTWTRSPTNYGPICRSDSPTTTGRDFMYTQRFGNIYITKIINGSATNLANSAASSTAIGDVDRIQADGSDFTGFINGSADVSVSDGSLSGQLRAGFYIGIIGITAIFGDYESADLGGGGGGITYVQLESLPRGINRGIWVGRP